MDKQNLWQLVLSDLELQVSKVVYQTLLAHTTLESISDSQATIGCHRPLLVNLIEKRYYQLIKKTLDDYTQKNMSLVFTTKTSPSKNPIDGPLFTIKLTPDSSVIGVNIKLDKDYTFANFAVSSSNQMAYAAATAVSKNPGTSYNPLFLYGGVGVGKTHLMQAIGHYVLGVNPKCKIIFCTGEEFTNEIIEAISTKTTTQFKKKYRQADMLLIDDVQFIAGKYAIQEEFFHTFNAIYQTKKQVVLTSDRPPEEINKLEERLKSRFEGGLTIDIGLPDFELRTAILLIKAKQRRFDLSIEHAKLLAANVDNIRKLEGLFIRVISESQTKEVPVDAELIKNILGRTVKDIPGKKRVSETEVLNAVTSYYNLKLSQLKGTRRDRFLSLPRQVLYYLLRVELGVSLLQIGEFLGGRDHTTVLHGVRKISGLLSADDKIREDIVGIKTVLFG